MWRRNGESWKSGIGVAYVKYYGNIRREGRNGSQQ
jgi:hypothetical protein